MRIIFRTKAAGAAFVHPLDPAPKTAILTSGFRESRNVRVFPEGWTEHAARFSPTAIAGPIEQLRRVARRGVALQHAVIALTYRSGPALSDIDREFLWRAFGVPVFEQFLGANNELLATECEAHQGLHIFGEWNAGPLDTSMCACGSKTPRLSSLVAQVA
jgi:hypothetical protein